MWVDWAAWLAEHGQPPVKVVPGSQRALWDGTAVYLGIGPRTQDGRVEVFHRDIEKNFVPLLGPEPAVPKTPGLVVIDPATAAPTRAVAASSATPMRRSSRSIGRAG